MAGASIRGSPPEFVRPARWDREAHAPPPAGPDGGDWPHTRRALPWLLAGFVGMLFLIPFDSLELPVQLPFNSKFDRVFLAGIVIVWAAGLLGARAAAPRLVRNPLAAPVLVFLFVALLSVAFNLETIGKAGELDLAVKKLALLGSYVAFFFVVATVIRPSEARAFTALFVGLAVISAIGTIWEYRTDFNVFYEWSDKLLPGFSQLARVTEVDAIGRRPITGPTQHGLAVTTLLSFAFPFALIGVLRSTERRRKLLYGAAAALIAAGTFATARKTAVFVPLATVLVLALYRPRDLLRLAPLLLVIVPAIHVLAPESIGSIRQQLFPAQGFFSQGTVSNRKSDWDAVTPDIRNHLAFGRGWGTYEPKEHRLLDNQYLGLLIEIGFIGAAAYLLMILAVAWFAHPLVKSGDPIRGPPALGAAAAAIGLAVAGALFDVLAFAQVPYGFLFLAGMLVAVRSERPRRPAPANAARRSRNEHHQPELEPISSDGPRRHPVTERPTSPKPGRMPASTPSRAPHQRPPRRPAGGGARTGSSPRAERPSARSGERSATRSRVRASAIAGGLARGRRARRRLAGRIHISLPALNRRGGRALAAATVIALAASGLLAGRQASDPDSAAKAHAVRADGLKLTAPGDWRVRVGSPAGRAMGLRTPIELAPEAGPRGSGLIAGRAVPSDPGLLPPAVVQQLEGPPPRPARVRLSAFSAYRYRALRLQGDRRVLTLYATPTTGGAVVVACLAPPGRAGVLADCERVAGSLSLARLSPLPLEPSPRYTRLLDRTVQLLNSRRTAHRRALRRARTRRGQARAASALARAHKAAATAIARAPVGPLQRPANERLVLALTRAERGYAQLASAARRRGRRAFARARRVVARRDSALRRAVVGVNPPDASR